MYVEHWRKLAWATLLGNLPRSTYDELEYVTVYATMLT